MLAAALRHMETSICNQGEGPLNTDGSASTCLSESQRLESRERGLCRSAPSLSAYRGSLLWLTTSDSQDLQNKNRNKASKD